MNYGLPFIATIATVWFLAALFLFLWPRVKAIQVHPMRSDAEVISGFSQVVVKVVFESDERREVSSDLLADFVYRFGARGRELGGSLEDEVSAEMQAIHDEGENVAGSRGQASKAYQNADDLIENDEAFLILERTRDVVDTETLVLSMEEPG